MSDRLALMHDVARTKWNANRPVGDPEREQALLREMEEEGQKHGLAPEFTRPFFAAQIAAARRVQEADLARWRAEGRGPFADEPDLAALRRRIDALNRDLVGALAEARPRLAGASTRDQLRRWAREALAGEGITDDVRAAAVEPLTVPWSAPPPAAPRT
jgi:chorismate mutase